MAKARRVIADQSSAEVEQLRKTVNTLLLVLRSVANDLSTAASIAVVNNIGTGLKNAIDTGLDSAGTNYTGTSLVIEGLIPSPRHPNRPRAGASVDLDSAKL